MANLLRERQRCKATVANVRRRDVDDSKHRPHRQPIKGNRIGLELPRHRALQAASFLIGQR